MPLWIKIVATIVALALTLAATLQIFNTGWAGGNADHSGEALGTFAAGLVLIVIIWCA